MSSAIFTSPKTRPTAADVLNVPSRSASPLQKQKQQEHAKSAIRHNILRPHLNRPGVRREPVRRNPKSPTQTSSPVAPSQPPTQEDVQTALMQVSARSARFPDMELGQEIALRLPAIQAHISSKVSFVDEALRKYCNSVGLRRLPARGQADIIRYQHPETSNRLAEFKLPVVWMSNLSAPGVDTTRPAAHGFAWVFSPNCADIDRLGPFHLVNAPGHLDAWGQRAWHYCGKYYAHRTGRLMSVEGWRELPQTTRDGAASIHSQYSSSSQLTCSDAYAQFESGLRCAELVILQFCGLPGASFFNKLNEAVALCLRPAKPPSAAKKRPNVEELTRNDPQFAELYRSIEARKSTRSPI